MKKLGLGIVCLVLIFNGIIYAANGVLPGSGTENDPYLIEDFTDFQKFFKLTYATKYWSEGIHTKLMCNIDLNPSLPDRAIYESALIGNSKQNPYYGYFDGNMHSIHNFTATGDTIIGLFGILKNATVKNLGVENVYINCTGKLIAGLAAISSDSITENCYTTGTIAGNETVGGLIGHSGGLVKRCYSSCNVFCNNDYCGGLIANSSSDANISLCYSTGSVESSGSYVGGLIGRTGDSTIIRNCYSTCDVNGNTYVGGLIGECVKKIQYSYSSGKVQGIENVGGLAGSANTQTEYCYFYVYGGPDNLSGTPLDDEELLEQTFYLGFDFKGNNSDGTNNYWIKEPNHLPYLYWQTNAKPSAPYLLEKIETSLEGSGYPEDPFILSSKDSILELKDNVSLRIGYFALTNDIDLIDHIFTESVINESFGGHLNGNGYSIKNLTIISSNHKLGLFRELAGSINTLALEDINITCTSGISACFASINNTGTITNCYSTGNILGSALPGGVVGTNLPGAIITNCYTTCFLEDNTDVYIRHGIVNSNYKGAIVNNSFFDIERTGVFTELETAKHTYEMLDIKTYIDAGWDFSYTENTSNTWFILPGDYPKLKGSQPSNIISLPELTGMTQNQAELIVENAGLKLGNILYEYNISVPLGQVIKQVPDHRYLLHSADSIDLIISQFDKIGGGDGTESNPYLINNMNDFDFFCSNSDYWHDRVFVKLECDLDLAMKGIYSLPPIGVKLGTPEIEYNGVFDGNNHTISNFSLTTSRNSGLFWKIGTSGKVKNLTISNAIINGKKNNIGAIAGVNYGSIINCHVKDSIVQALQSWDCNAIGGITGANTGIITKSSSSAIVKGNLDIGILTGGNNNGTITFCFSEGIATGKECVGGLVGVNNSEISNCYSIGQVTGSKFAGGLAGKSKNTITNCYSSCIVRGNEYAGSFTGDNGSEDYTYCYSYIFGGDSFNNGTPLDDNQLINKENFHGFDFANDATDGTEDIWLIENGHMPKLYWQTDEGFAPPNYNNSYTTTLIGNGTFNSPYIINTFDDLLEVRNNKYLRYGHYILGNNIDLSGHSFESAFIDDIFYGVFIANGNIISNLTINGENYLGFVGNNHGYINGLVLENINISGTNNYIGGIAGYNKCKISDCISSGTICGNRCVGGISGGSSDISSINNCSSKCSVTGNECIGGLIGTSSSLTTNCYSESTVEGISLVGGLIGFCYNDIFNCYAKATVVGQESTTGGLVGSFNNSYKQIENCFFDGNITSITGSGGLVGDNNGKIIKCYSVGSNTSQSPGGLANLNQGIINNSYFSGNLSITSSNKLSGGIVAKNLGSIENCHFNGFISNPMKNIYIHGVTKDGDVKNCFWNIDTSGITSGSPIGAIGIRNDEINKIDTFIQAGWDFVTDNNSNGVWVMSDYPVLAALSEIVNIPNIVNLSLADGYNRLADNGLKIGKLHYVKSFNIPFGEIISQSREPGDYTTTETLIDLEVSSGLPVELSGNGTETNPYKITTLDEFDSFAFNHDYWQENVYTELTVDLDLNPEGIGRSIYPSAIIAADTDSSKPFFQGIEYNGIFNGNGHTISNIQINTSGNDNDYIGLFGKLGPDAVISDLTINNASILIDQTCYYIGILCGDNQGLITKCKTSGTIDCSLGADYLGGLCGINNGGQIEQSYSEANIFGTSSSRPIGGLVAENAGGIILNCHYTGNISGSSNLGGLCGINSDGTILECFSSGKVTSNNDSLSIGGLCGYNEWGEISNNYSAVEIICNQNGKRIGGLCGDNNEGIISNCYTTSDIDLGRSTTYAGGFCGENYKGKIENSYSIAKLQLDHNDIYGGFCGRNLDEVINCFWDEQNTEIDISDGGEAKNTEQMQSFATYLNAEWSINESVATDWIMLSSDYPKLAWQQGIFTKGEMEISLKPNQNGKIIIQLYTLSDDNFVWKINDIESCPWITSISPNYGEFTKAGEMVNVEINIDSTGLAVGDYLFQMPVKIFSNQADYFLTSLHVVDTVDLYDFSLLAEWWLLNCENNSECNLIDSNNDYIINFDDLNNLADQWLSSSSNNNGFIADFETGQLLSYGFKIPDTFAWEVQSEEISSGNYAARTGVISDNQQSKIEIIVNCSEGDAISFDRKVSSEQIWDTLSFYIDDVLYDQWSGELDWESFVYDLMPGVHSFRWEYSKDESISEGLDAAWLDNVRID